MKDWPGKKDPHFSDDRPSFNRNLQVANGGNSWPGDYVPARDVPVNSDVVGTLQTSRSPSRFDKRRVNDRLLDRREDENARETRGGRADALDHSDIVSPYDRPIRADDLTAPGKYLAAITNGESKSAPLSLESLRMAVLELRNDLAMDDERGNTIPPTGDTIISLSTHFHLPLL